MVKTEDLQGYLKAAAAALFMLVAGCGENAPDCLQTAGDTIREEVRVAPFQRVTVFENIRLVIQQGTPQRVMIQTGEHLRPEVSAKVVEGTLELRDANNCNLFRDYGETIITVITPELEQIRSSTGWPVSSDGPLAFEDLQLVSESFNNPETTTTDGSFELELATGRVRVTLNGISSVRLTGQTELLQVTIAAGDSRVDAGALEAQRVRIDHRGSNSLQVNPRQELEGVIRGYGDVLSYFRPERVEVEELFRGRLLFVE